MLDLIVNNRYKIIKAIGSGAMGKVCLAHDLLRENRNIALKILNSSEVSERRIKFFKNEFEVMTRLRHPNLVRVYDFGYNHAGPFYYIAMEYLDGLHIKDVLDGTDDLMFAKTVCDLCRALGFIHSRSILHRDIKPSNIMFSGQTVRLMDFGLADPEKSSTNSKGTIQYMAPEVLRGHAGPESDIFSLGLTLYELLTGIDFFDESESQDIVSTLLHQENFVEYTKIKFLKLKNSPFLSLIEQMISFNKTSRLAMACDVIYALNHLGLGNFEYETVLTKEAYVLGAGFVGRENEIARLKGLVKAGSRKALLVRGEAGIGKSRLLQEFRKYCLLSEISWLEGHCHENIFRLYQPFVPIISRLLYTLTDDGFDIYAPELKKIIPDHPRLTNVKKAASYEPEEERLILHNTIINVIIDSFIENPGKYIIYINDVQWIDEASLEIASSLIDKIGSAPFDMIFTTRNTTTSPFCNNVNGRLEVIDLKPFASEHSISFITTLFSHDTIGDSLEKEIPGIHRKVGGNPFFLQELVKTLVDTGNLDRDHRGWQLLQSLDRIGLPDTLSEMINRRLSVIRFSDDERILLYTLAMLDRKTTISELEKLTSTDMLSLATLLDKELITASSGEEATEYSISHELVRQSVIEKIENKPVMHENLGSTLEEIHSDNLDVYVDELAYHFYHAGNHVKAAKYLEQAADQASEVYNLRKAIGFYDQLSLILNDNDVKHKIDVLLKESAMLLLHIDYDKCKRIIEEAVALAKKIDDKKRLADAYSRLGKFYLDNYQVKESVSSFEKAVAAYEAVGDSYGLVRALNYQAFNSGMYLYDYTRGILLHQKAINIATRLDDLEGLAINIANRSVLYIQLGRFQEAVQNLHKSLNLVEIIADKVRYPICIGYIGLAYRFLGKYELALFNLDRSIKSAEEIEARKILAYFMPEKAYILLQQSKFDEAEKWANKAIGLACKTEEIDGLRNASLYLAKIHVAYGKKNQAKQLLTKMLDEWPKVGDRAYILYELWNISRDEEYYHQALKINREAYRINPVYLYKIQIEDLEAFSQD